MFLLELVSKYLYSIFMVHITGMYAKVTDSNHTVKILS